MSGVVLYRPITCHIVPRPQPTPTARFTRVAEYALSAASGGRKCLTSLEPFFQLTFDHNEAAALVGICRCWIELQPPVTAP